MYDLDVIIATVALMGVGLGGTGCQTPNPSSMSRKEIAQRSKRETSALYDAIVATYEARDLSIDLASEKFLIVRSTYEKVEPRLRRRFVARIVRLPGGASALRVRLEHQRRHGTGDEAVWKTVESPLLQKRAREKELELGRAIESRYRERDASSNDSN